MPSDKKNRERTEGAATAVQAKHGDSYSANWVNLDPKSSTSFDDDSTGPPAFLCSRDDCAKVVSLPLGVAGGLLPAGTTSTATITTFD